MGTIIGRTRKDGTAAYVAQILIKRKGLIAHRESQTFDRKQAAKASEPPTNNSQSTTNTAPADQYKIIITCRDEAHQTELLDRFEQEKIECKALVG